MELLHLSIYGVFALGFYIGAVFVHHNVYNPLSNGPYGVSDVLTVFFLILKTWRIDRENYRQRKKRKKKPYRKVLLLDNLK